MLWWAIAMRVLRTERLWGPFSVQWETRMDVPEMLRIAARYQTEMARAMIGACVTWLLAMGVPFEVPELPERKARPPIVRPGEDLEHDEWERMVRTNSDTRAMHC